MRVPSSLRLVSVAVLLPAFLAGCAPVVPTSTVTTNSGHGGAATDGATDRTGPFARVYTCPDGFRFSARADTDRARLDLGTRRLTLAGEPTDTGMQYTDGQTQFETRGNEATLEIDASIRSGCRGQNAADPWEAAALRGVDVRALGQEPGWSAEVVRGEWLRFARADAGGLLVAPDPARNRTGNGVTVYTARADGRLLRLQLTEAACTDSMSGESYPLTARLTLDGRALRGCARRLAASGADR